MHCFTRFTRNEWKHPSQSQKKKKTKFQTLLSLPEVIYFLYLKSETLIGPALLFRRFYFARTEELLCSKNCWLYVSIVNYKVRSEATHVSLEFLLPQCELSYPRKNLILKRYTCTVSMYVHTREENTSFTHTRESQICDIIIKMQIFHKSLRGVSSFFHRHDFSFLQRDDEIDGTVSMTKHVCHLSRFTRDTECSRAGSSLLFQHV